MGKQLTKALGLKNTLISDDEIYMISSGQGNNGDIEKHIVGKNIENVKNTFNAELSDVEDEVVKAVSIYKNPKKKACVNILDIDSANQLHAKSAIENMIFGKNYNDNIHIQIAYNILDLRKQLNYYSNFIINSIDSWLMRDSTEQEYEKGHDFVGMFNAYADFAKAELAYNIISMDVIDKKRSQFNYFFDLKKLTDKHNRDKFKLMFDAIGYKGGRIDLRSVTDFLVKNCGWKKYKFIETAARNYQRCLSLINTSIYFSDCFVDNKSNFDSKKCYDIISLMSDVRNKVYHTSNEADSTWIYSNSVANYQRDTLDKIFGERLDGINKNFISQNEKNLIKLFKIYPNDEENVVKSYYSFIVLKESLSLSISIKKLREAIQCLDDAKYIKDQAYDSIRAKLYNILDFMLFNFYKSNPDILESAVNNLREAMDDESKAIIYERQAKIAWDAVCADFKKYVLPKPQNGVSDNENAKSFVDSLKCSFSDEEKATYNRYLEKVLKNSDDFFVFTKILYAMTLFLDAKEINQFITQLINKFSNIASLIDTLNEIKQDESYFEKEVKAEYKMFTESHRVVEELNVLKAIARMNKGTKAKKNQMAKVKKCHYLDAAAVLGCTDTKKAEELFNLNQSGKGADHAMRNFIINNVIVSRQFNYIVRFLNPKQARKIMQNKACLKFVLKDLPDEQIIKYCQSTQTYFDAENPNFAKMRSELAKIMYNLKLEDFSSVKMKVKPNSKEDREKQQKIGVLNLYLTVLYLFVKNLVRVNTYYTVAIGTLERDSQIMGNLYKRTFYNPMDKYKSNAMSITRKFVEQKYVNPTIIKCYNDELLGDNEYKLYSDNRFRLFRNAIAHLLVISNLHKYIDNIHNVNSYFDLYHTIMFLFIADNDSTLKECCAGGNLNLYELVKNTNNAPRNFVHAITLPFAYCPARYINLSDKNKFEKTFGQ